MKKKFARGAEWRRWDLHIHTKGTAKSSRFKSANFHDFCVTFFKRALENEIQAIGITDYFNIENYKKVCDFVRNLHDVEELTEDEKSKVRDIFLLPNVELRMLPSTDSGKLVNIHCIFNPDYVEKLDNDFFSSIEYSASPGKKYKMNRQGMIELGQSLDASLQGDGAWKKGVNNFAITHADIQGLLDTRSDFRENTIVVVANARGDGASGLRKHYESFENEKASSLDGVRKSIYGISHCIFSGNPGDRQYFLGAKEGSDDRETVIDKCGSLKPCIHGSDAHDEESLFKPAKNRYCWIKADLTFKGLRSILFEPESRVVIQEDKPRVAEDYRIIEQVEFIEGGSGKFMKSPILLNQGLNTIVGGKSSGKSLLLYQIAKAIDPKETERIIKIVKGDDAKRDKKNSNLYKQLVGGSDFKIRWKDQREDLQSVPSAEPRRMIYIPQGYINKLSDPETQKTRKHIANLIRDILKDRPEGGEIYNSFLDDVKAQDDVRRSLVSKFFNQLEAIKARKDAIKGLGGKDGVLHEVSVIKKAIGELQVKANLKPEEVEQFEVLSKQIKGCDETLASLTKEKSSVASKVDELGGKLQESIQLGREIASEISEPEWRRLIGDQIELLKESDDSLSRKILRIKMNYEKLYGVKIKNLVDLKEEANKNLEPLLEKYSNKKAIEDKQKEKEKLQKKLIDIELALKEIEQLSKDQTQTKSELFKAYRHVLSYYDDVTEKLNALAKKHVEDMRIVGSSRFYYNKYKLKFFDSYINQQNKTKLDGLTLLEGKTRYQFDPEVLFKEIEETFDNVMSGNFKLRNNVSKQEAVNGLFTDAFFDYWEVHFNNDEIGDMSPGKANLVLLKLIIELSEDNCPILIDQPEDNLDNRSIYTQLVSYIKKRKQNRQFIVVTHNPNLVVAADAENVIVANQKDQGESADHQECRFEYSTGALEESFEVDKKKKEVPLLDQMGIREHVCHLLEGGKTAFKERESKYGFIY